MSNIIFETVHGVDTIGITDQFLRTGKIFLTGVIDSSSCDEATKQLLYLEENSDISEITIYIDSPGGRGHSRPGPL